MFLVPAGLLSIISVVDFWHLSNNKELIAKLLKEINEDDLSTPLNLMTAAMNAEKSPEKHEHYLLISWKKFHRSFHENEIHVRYRVDNDHKELEIFVFPAVDKSVNLDCGMLQKFYLSFFKLNQKIYLWFWGFDCIVIEFQYFLTSFSRLVLFFPLILILFLALTFWGIRNFKLPTARKFLIRYSKALLKHH